MFVELLNEQQQAILLQHAKRLVEADGVLHEEEKKIIDTIRAQMSASALEMTPGELVAEFTTQKSKVALLLELIGIAKADVNYDASEREMILQIGKELNVDIGLIEKLEDWVGRQFGLVAEAYGFMQED